MNCTDARKRLALRLEGGLSTSESSRLDAHLQECLECAREMAALRRTGELLGMTPLEQAPEFLDVRVQAGLEERGRSLHLPRIPRWAAVGSLVVMLIGLAVEFHSPAPPTTTAQQDQGLLSQHVAMGWNEPLADQSALALDLASSTRGVE